MRASYQIRDEHDRAWSTPGANRADMERMAKKIVAATGKLMCVTKDGRIVTLVERTARRPEVTRVDSIAERAIIRRLRAYAAKWRAEHDLAEPPVHEEPTDAALAACFAGCARPAHPGEYAAIRAAIRGQR